MEALCNHVRGRLDWSAYDAIRHEPADILVIGKIVAHGEIVTIDGHYGVRVTAVEP